MLRLEGMLKLLQLLKKYQFNMVLSTRLQAGSRYEPQTELGISHVLRSAAGLSTGKASSFMISRKLAQIGATFNASGDRELIYYTLEASHSRSLGGCS
ncbi:unnamed protein product [Leptidea sinapis]|uniref:Peptidase M16 N-terminal domain-containing protein n=1 Tax=Leptidea sinapis TaxID=189913 RepID=A0A5E4R480_9NEOP|nr:unnamed protein product [Leptidea sinapis]